MPIFLNASGWSSDQILDPVTIRNRRFPSGADYVFSLLLVVLATLLGFGFQRLIPASNLTLVYVLPVVVAANAFGWGPSLLAVASSAMAFDFFFTRPYYSLSMSDPSEIWAVVLLLVIATIVASISARSYRRALDAIEAANRIEALQDLAHVTLHSGSQRDVLRAAATAMNRIFHAPVVIFVQNGGNTETAASVGCAQVTDADREAARGALSSHLGTRGGMYPYVGTHFDFWPVPSAVNENCVLGVDFAHSDRERPASFDRLIEGVAGYVVSTLASGKMT